MPLVLFDLENNAFSGNPPPERVSERVYTSTSFFDVIYRLTPHDKNIDLQRSIPPILNALKKH